MILLLLKEILVIQNSQSRKISDSNVLFFKYIWNSAIKGIICGNKSSESISNQEVA